MQTTNPYSPVVSLDNKMLANFKIINFLIKTIPKSTSQIKGNSSTFKCIEEGEKTAVFVWLLREEYI